ncbi:MAG: hypothetical protein ABIV63_19905 [Caldimonas sp.]
MTCTSASRPALRAPVSIRERAVLDLALALLVCAGLCMATGVARAADKPRESSFGKVKPGARVLTPVELRECLSQQDKLHAGTDEMTRQQATLTANKAEIDRLGIGLKEQSATLDRTSADAVAAYNVQAQSRDKMIDEYQDGVSAFNAKVEALKTDQAVFAKGCENRRYDEADEMSIRKTK